MLTAIYISKTVFDIDSIVQVCRIAHVSRSIVITSGKGGVGKTTLTANIGYALAMDGARVVLVDTDIGLRNLDVILGLENRVVWNILHVASRECELRKALVKDKRLSSNLYLLPAAQTFRKDDLGIEEMDAIVQSLKTAFDYVILDCPAGIEYGFNNAIQPADDAVVVVTPEIASVRDADRVIGLLETAGKKNISLIINRLKPDMVSSGDMLSIEDVIDILAIKLLGVVPDDRNVIVSTNRGEPVILNQKTDASKALSVIGRRLQGFDVPIPEFGVDGFWKRISSAIRRN